MPINRNGSIKANLKVWRSSFFYRTSKVVQLSDSVWLWCLIQCTQSLSGWISELQSPVLLPCLSLNAIGLDSHYTKVSCTRQWKLLHVTATRMDKKCLLFSLFVKLACLLVQFLSQQICFSEVEGKHLDDFAPLSASREMVEVHGSN